MSLPKELVNKYNGKGMAIVGWEIDQVRRTPQGDESVPISASYNHHYGSKVIGGGAHFEKALQHTQLTSAHTVDFNTHS